jgi:predicted RNase H-like HicB family nuclease
LTGSVESKKAESQDAEEAMKFRVLFEVDEDGVWVATCPTLPGCVSQGRTRAEAEANVREAMEGYLASLKKHGEPMPHPAP